MDVWATGDCLIQANTKAKTARKYTTSKLGRRQYVIYSEYMYNLI